MDRRVYVAMREVLLIARTDGDGWEATSALGGSSLEAVTVDPRRPDRVFVGTFGHGLLVSNDGGDSFERVGETTIGPDAVMSVAVHPDDPDEVFVGTEPSALFRSEDGGETWEEIAGITAVESVDEWFFPPRPHTHHVRWIEIDPNDPERIYVGIEAGALLLSPDGGATWRDRPTGSRRDNHTLATHPAAPGRVYAAAGDGYAESTDAGRSWAHPQEGLDHRYVWGLAVDPGDPDRVLVSAAHGASSAHRSPGEAYLYRRDDATAWERLDDAGVPTGPGALRAVLGAGLEAGELYAATGRGLYVTADGGETFEAVPIDWPAPAADTTARDIAIIDAVAV